jgi:hypothetical protein
MRAAEKPSPSRTHLALRAPGPAAGANGLGSCRRTRRSLRSIPFSRFLALGPAASESLPQLAKPRFLLAPVPPSHPQLSSFLLLLPRASKLLTHPPFPPSSPAQEFEVDAPRRSPMPGPKLRAGGGLGSGFASSAASGAGQVGRGERIGGSGRVLRDARMNACG